jgi:hypothetical protein
VNWREVAPPHMHALHTHTHALRRREAGAPPPTPDPSGTRRGPGGRQGRLFSPCASGASRSETVRSDGNQTVSVWFLTVGGRAWHAGGARRTAGAVRGLRRPLLESARPPPLASLPPSLRPAGFGRGEARPRAAPACLGHRGTLLPRLDGSDLMAPP